MSYCRFSTGDVDSDVYVYASDDGWITHVATTRTEPAEQLPAPVTIEPSEDEAAWVKAVLERERAVVAILSRSRSVPIGLPHDGSHYLDASPGDCASTLEMLAGAGYHVPGEVIEDLRAEQAGLEGGYARHTALSWTPYHRNVITDCRASRPGLPNSLLLP